jgi:transposase
VIFGGCILNQNADGQEVQHAVPQPVHLSASDHERLSVVVHRGKANVRTLKPAQVLVKLDAGWAGAEIAEACDVSQNTVGNVRKRFLTGGLDMVLSDRRQERRRAALTRSQQAHLIAIAYSPAPEGHDHWPNSTRSNKPQWIDQ